MTDFQSDRGDYAKYIFLVHKKWALQEISFQVNSLREWRVARFSIHLARNACRLSSALGVWTSPLFREHSVGRGYLR
jgi:hypothetical protein